MPTVYLAYGKGSGPWGPKSFALADVARSKGFEVAGTDYSDLADPEERVKRLHAICAGSTDTSALVGSSMGGYISAAASSDIKPAGVVPHGTGIQQTSREAI